jgi:hypothetical protein
MQQTGTLISPDGRWRWDGSDWIPNVAAEPRRPGPGFNTWFRGETSEDLFTGQHVIVWARWILITTGLLLSFWIPSGTRPDLLTLQVQLGAIVALAFGNFYLHVQLLRGKPAIDRVVYGAACGDLGVITALVLIQHGFASPFFVFYCAAVLGLSVAFPTAVTAIYTVCTIAVYGLVGAATAPTDQYATLVIRLLMIAAVAVCGNLFARHEALRRAEAKEARSVNQAAQEDVFFGQSVILWARWGVILAGTLLVLSTSSSVSQLVRTLPFFLALMAMNFFLHGRYVMGSPLNRYAVIAASVADLLVVTAIVVFWPGPDGLRNEFYVLYFPIVFAFALVFERRIEVAYTALAVGAYTAAAVLLGTVASEADIKLLVLRLIVLGAMGFLGNYYFRSERERLRRLSSGEPSALQELQARVAAVR